MTREQQNLLLSAPKSFRFQLIVLGARYCKRLLMSLRSTVTDRVCRRPCCPVLVVP